MSQSAYLRAEREKSLSNSIRVASETTHIGANTLTKLAEQKEQLQSMDSRLDSTNESVTRSNRLIRGMKSFGGNVANFFTGPKHHKSKTVEIKVDPSQPVSLSTSILPTSQTTEDKQLDILGGLIDTLKMQAQEMNRELNIHNQIIGHLELQVVDTTDRIKKSTREIKNIT